MYEDKFNKALERTRKFGLSVPKLIRSNSGRFLSEKAQEELPYIIRDSLGVLDEDEIVLQCLLLNARLKNVFSEHFGCPVYYTIGYVGIDDQFMFKQTEESLFSMLKNGISGPSIRLHAWLTLPSMEILDFSFPTSYGRVNGNKRNDGSCFSPTS